MLAKERKNVAFIHLKKAYDTTNWEAMQEVSKKVYREGRKSC